MMVEYWAAVDTYRSGFDLSRDIFDDAGYEKELVARVDDETARVTESLEQFAALQDLLQEHLDAEARSFRNRDLESYTLDFGVVLQDLRQLTELLVVLDNSSSVFNTLERAIQLSIDSTDEIHHIVYLILLIQGREESLVPEGIWGAVDEIWTTGTSVLAEHTGELFQEEWDQAHAALAERDFQTARSSFEEIPRLAALDLSVVSLWAGRLRPGVDGQLDEDDLGIIDFWMSRANETVFRSMTAEPYIQYMAISETLDALDSEFAAMVTVEEAPPIRLGYQNSREETQGLLDSWGGKARGASKCPPGMDP